MAPGSSPGSQSNPRKFSEKIALHRQKEAADTAAFEDVLKEISAVKELAQVKNVPQPQTAPQQPHPRVRDKLTPSFLGHSRTV